MSTAEHAQKEAHGATGVILTAVGVFLLIYLLFPPLLMWPIIRSGLIRDPKVRAVFEVAFAPVSKLYDTLPLYRSLITTEWELLKRKRLHK